MLNMLLNHVFISFIYFNQPTSIYFLLLLFFVRLADTNKILKTELCHFSLANTTSSRGVLIARQAEILHSQLVSVLPPAEKQHCVSEKQQPHL